VPSAAPPVVADGGCPPPAPAFDGKMPLGAMSVVAAGGGPVQYLPVPVVTIPDVRHPPCPPEAAIPGPPQPNLYVNAFTPTHPVGPMSGPPALMAQGQPMGMAPGQPMPYGDGPMPMMPPNPAYAMAAGYGPNPYAVPPGYMPNPYAALAQGYGPNPYAAMPQGYGPNPYAAMPQPMASPYPYGGAPAMMQTGGPSVYQGPMPPPNPFASAPVVPVSYNPAAPAYGAMNPAMDRRNAALPAMLPVQTSAPDMVRQLASTLREGLYPSQRELAADALTACDWHYYPQALQALLIAAREDPAATVRAACVNAMMRMNATNENVLNVLKGLRNDPDPRVRHEVEQALARHAAATQAAARQ
jgi:HEAT repeats